MNRADVYFRVNKGYAFLLEVETLHTTDKLRVELANGASSVIAALTRSAADNGKYWVNRWAAAQADPARWLSLYELGFLSSARCPQDGDSLAVRMQQARAQHELVSAWIDRLLLVV